MSFRVVWNTFRVGFNFRGMVFSFASGFGSSVLFVKGLLFRRVGSVEYRV